MGRNNLFKTNQFIITTQKQQQRYKRKGLKEEEKTITDD